MLDVVDGVVHRARSEGTSRTDVGTGDIAVAFLFLAHPVPIEPEGTARLASQRCMALLLESLRVPANTRLPGDPLASPAVHA